jgi:hypothetical protein
MLQVEPPSVIALTDVVSVFFCNGPESKVITSTFMSPMMQIRDFA